MRTNFRFRISHLIALAIALLAACGDNTPGSSKELTSFAFLAANNSQLRSDVVATISGDRIDATMPYGTDVSALVATYATTGGAIYVATNAQHSGVTANNFSQSIDYVVSAADHTTTSYTVSVTVAESSAKALTTFSFLAANNPGLSSDVIATISGSSIGAIMPYGTDITALTPTFSTTGVSVTVGTAMQLSGHTADDFESAMVFVVTAADKSTQAYAVTVVVASNPAKQLTMFELTSALNSAAGVSSNEMATINGAGIAVTVPYGTDVTALVPTFVTTGQAVAIGATAQVSSMTAVDFTHAVTYVVTAADASTQSYLVTVTVAKNPAKALTAFSFTSALNSGISTDVVATISGSQIGATVPYGTDVTALVATFSTTGAHVAVGSAVQTSGVTAVDFSSPVTYTVTAADATTKAYTVTIAIASSPAKELTTFEFASTINGLPSDAVGVINGTAIAVTVPYATDPSALVSTFTTTGASVAVGGTVQASGITANDFTSPVDYTVTAADGTTKDFTVTVTVALDPAKDITAFWFASENNSGQPWSSDVIATITGTAITATVPYGTDVTQLYAAFSTTGASVAVGGVAQQSQVTANDFTQPVSYVVTAADGTTQMYTVTITVALSPAKDITSFTFTSALNGTAGVTSDAAGSISGTSISVYVPYGTDVTALVATFATTGASVTVGNVQQQSAVTSNDFTSPVSYTVTAADGTTQTYSVTVAPVSYATATLTGNSPYQGPVSSTKQLVFLYAPAGTEIDSDAGYKAYCEAFGFEQNQNNDDPGDGSFFQAGMYSATDFYCSINCCYLGSGNSAASTITNFQNFGLPLNSGLQVFDRGCGDFGEGFTSSVNTDDTLTLSSSTAYGYANGPGNFFQSKTTTFATDGVVVCETK